MAKITVAEAAKRWNKSRTTLYAKMNTGELSFVRSGKARKIDVSELIRVFGDVQVDSSELSNLNTTLQPVEQPNDALLKHLQDEVKYLRGQVEALTEQIAKREAFEQKLLSFDQKKRWWQK